jgi:TPR repeat protein
MVSLVRGMMVAILVIGVVDARANASVDDKAKSDPRWFYKHFMSGKRAPDVLDLPILSEPESSRDSEMKLAIRTTQLIQDDMRAAYAAGDESKGHSLAEQARDELAPLLEDPEQAQFEAWRLAGINALMLDDDDLAALAYEAIERLKPDFAADDSTLTLMARLKRRNIADRVPGIRTDHKFAIISFRHATKGDPDAMRAFGIHLHLGRGVPKNDSASVRWILRAALSGNTDGLDDIATLRNQKYNPPSRKIVELCTALNSRAGYGDATAMYILATFVKTKMNASCFAHTDFFTADLNDHRQQVSRLIYQASAELGNPLAIKELNSTDSK